MFSSVFGLFLLSIGVYVLALGEAPCPLALHRRRCFGRAGRQHASRFLHGQAVLAFPGRATPLKRAVRWPNSFEIPPTLLNRG
jgi:hypothetical protein